MPREFSNYTRRERKSIKSRLPACAISRDVFGPYLRISFEIIRRRRSTLSYAAARARCTRIMLTMPLRLALRRRRRHIFYFLSLCRSRPIAWRPTIVEKGKRNRRWTCGEGDGAGIGGMRRLLENCSHNSSRDRYYYRTRWNVSVAPRLQLRKMHLNSIQPGGGETVWRITVAQML